MSDENTQNGTNETKTALPIPPSTNGIPSDTSGAADGDQPGKAAASNPPSETRSNKKKKHHQRGQASQTATSIAQTSSTPEGAAVSEAAKTPGTSEAEAPATQSPAPIAAEPIETPTESLRLRAKVWTDPATGKRYLMPAAFMRDVVGGKPVSDVMHAYAMRDDDTKLVTLRAAEWNALPFFYFQEDGPAPRASARPVDVVG